MGWTSKVAERGVLPRAGKGPGAWERSWSVSAVHLGAVLGALVWPVGGTQGAVLQLTCVDCSALLATAAWPSSSSGAALQSWVKAWGCRQTRRCPRHPWP